MMLERSRLCSMPSFLCLLLFLSFDTVLSFSCQAHRTTLRQNTRRHLFFSQEDRNGFHQKDVPYVIERLGDDPKDVVFREIADMCIDVFFNEQETRTTPWKHVQLSYLRNLQRSDLCNRKTSSKYTNDMFVARRVVPATDSKAALKSTLILDTTTIINNDALSPSDDLIKGDVIGFVEVTERHYGLGAPFDNAAERGKHLKMNFPRTPSLLKRPVLTNLSVHPNCRKAGVGSHLLQTCEETVATDWNKTEIVLEVENDNPAALRFYQKRGYDVVFEDPAGRRFDANGLFLQKKQCTKICMRKELLANEDNSSVMMGPSLLQTLKETVFSRQ